MVWFFLAILLLHWSCPSDSESLTSHPLAEPGRHRPVWGTAFGRHAETWTVAVAGEALAQNAELGTISNTAAEELAEEISPPIKLTLALFAILAAIIFGAACKQFGLINPGDGDMKALEFFVGRVSFPLLVFKTVATSTVGAVDLRLILACSLGKLSVMFVTWMLAFLAYHRGRSRGQRFLTSSVFGFVVVSSNDFAIGFPVIQALYGVDMEIYLSVNALIISGVFLPLTTVLLGVGKSIKRTQDGVAEGDDVVRQTFKEILLNPVIVATLLGFMVNLALKQLHLKGLPHPLQDVVDLFTAPYSMLSLFMTGVSLRDPKITFWTCLLVLMKVVVCAYLCFLFAVHLGKGALPDELQDFSFFYGSIPTGGAPLVFAQMFDKKSVDIVATSILLGLCVAGPNMILTALFLDSRSDMTEVLIFTMKVVGNVSLLSGAAFIVLLSMRLRFWMYNTHKSGIAVYGVVAFIYANTLLYVSVMEKPCESLRAGHNWCLVRIVFNTLQKACIFLIFYLKSMPSNIGSSRRVSKGYSNITRPMAIFVLSIIPGVLSNPQTLSQICQIDYDNYQKMSSLITNLVLFAITIALAVPDLWRPYDLQGDSPNSQEANSSFNSNLEGIEIADLDARNMPDDGPDHISSAPPLRRNVTLQPDSFTVRLLFRIQGLRLLLQVVDSWSLPFGQKVEGSITQMLIIEFIMEHGQPLFLILGLIFDQSFKESILRAFILRKPQSEELSFGRCMSH